MSGDGIDNLVQHTASQLDSIRADSETVEERLDAVEGLLLQVAKEVQRREYERDRDADHATTLDKYAAMPDQTRQETPLGATDRRAVALYREWFDVARETPSGEYAVSTKRNPRKKHGRSDLKDDIERVCDESLAWNQIYRTMRRVAELSGGEHVTDEYDRNHVVGGCFEFHEKPTPDGEQVYKLLTLVDPEPLTLS